jgi:hypothetical protein
MSGSRLDGTFPQLGPVVYTAGSVAEARARLAVAPPPRRIWLHATTEAVVRRAVFEGLTPSCWRGGDCCAVCGRDRPEDVHLHEPDWLAEVESDALAGELKSWWVPASAIRGAWHNQEFFTREALREGQEPPKPSGGCQCHCELRELCSEQYEAWRRSCL